MLKLDYHSISAMAEVFEETLYPARFREAQLYINMTGKRFADSLGIRNNPSGIDVQL